jgi:hypothetical protein
MFSRVSPSEALLFENQVDIVHDGAVRSIATAFSEQTHQLGEDA